MNAYWRNLEEIFPAVRGPERIIRSGRRDVFFTGSAPNIDLRQPTPPKFEAALHQASTLGLIDEVEDTFDRLADRPVSKERPT